MSQILNFQARKIKWKRFLVFYRGKNKKIFGKIFFGYSVLI
jgi:hypothetical protein